MSEYKTVEDYAADQSFQDFVLDKSSKNVLKWQNYLTDNPDQLPKVEEAANIIKALSPGDIISIKKDLDNRSTSTNFQRRSIIALALLSMFFMAAYFLYNALNFTTEPVVKTVYQTALEKSSFNLPDGSLVTLKPNSKLEILGDWNKTRLSRLSGDAFLDISPDEDKAFIIETENDIVTVLGTKFSLATSNHFEIILEEGRVQHDSNQSDPMILTRNQKLVRNGEKVVVTAVDAKKFNFWKNEKLAFKGEKLIDIVDILQKSYGISISLQETKLESKLITAQVSENNPELVLKAIAEIYDIELISENDIYILK